MKLTEAVQRIRSAQSHRVSSMPNSNKVKIEVSTGDGWVTIMKDITRGMAEDIIRQASNKVILG